MTRRKLATTVYLEEEQVQRLTVLSELTSIPKTRYIREGVDLVLEKYAEELAEARSAGGDR